jgi:penicillin-binding protein 1A
VAGKTGTTDDYTDAWFVGFSPRLTLGVWVGRDLKHPIGRRMTGAEAALPIWISFMESYFANQGELETGEDFPVPAGVVFSTVDWYSGRLAVPGCDKVVLEAFLDGTEPVEACSPSHHRLAELPWPFQVPSYSPRIGEPMPSPAAVAIADGRATGRLE